MHQDSRKAHCTLGIDLAEIDRLNAVFADFADTHALPARLRRTMRMVFDELLNNTISYGGAGVIDVDVELVGDRLLVTISDDGKPFDPLEAEPPDTTRSTQERKIGGLGIYLVRQAMDEVGYARVAGRNVMTLTKRITDD